MIDTAQQISIDTAVTDADTAWEQSKAIESDKAKAIADLTAQLTGLQSDLAGAQQATLTTKANRDSAVSAAVAFYQGL